MPVFIAVISVFIRVISVFFPRISVFITATSGDIDLNIGQAPKLSRRDANSTGGKAARLAK